MLEGLKTVQVPSRQAKRDRHMVAVCLQRSEKVSQARKTILILCITRGQKSDKGFVFIKTYISYAHKLIFLKLIVVQNCKY